METLKLWLHAAPTMEINSMFVSFFFYLISGGKTAEIKAIFAFRKCPCHISFFLIDPHVRSLIKKVRRRDDGRHPLSTIFIGKQSEVVKANRDPNTTEWKVVVDESCCLRPII